MTDKNLQELSMMAKQATEEAIAKMRQAMNNLDPTILDSRPMDIETIQGKPGYSRPKLETASPRALINHYLSIMEREGLIQLVGKEKAIDYLLQCVRDCVERTLKQAPITR